VSDERWCQTHKQFEDVSGWKFMSNIRRATMALDLYAEGNIIHMVRSERGTETKRKRLEKKREQK
jgi:hypothetical protein